MGWSDDGDPQQLHLDATIQKFEFPPVPKTMIVNEPVLLQAIKDAVETVEYGASRYALECLQLQGKKGQIAATDSRQLLVQKGFKFPWKGDILVPANKVFACRDFFLSKQVEVGSTEDWFCLKTQRWTIYIRLEKDARFPNVNSHLPNPKKAVATLHLAESDEKFLKQSLKKLPNRDKLTSSVTIDLNGEVLLRSRGEHLSDSHELLLSNSTKSGEDICINTNRNYLARAIKLGFRDISLFGKETPAACIEEDRIYLWAVLDSIDITPPNAKTRRIASPVDSSTSSIVSPPSKRSTQQTMKKSTPQSKAKTKQKAQTEEPETNNSTPLIDQAEALRDSLQQTLTLSRNLLTDLKKQKKQSRLMQTTINSLRQLQTIDL